MSAELVGKPLDKEKPPDVTFVLYSDDEDGNDSTETQPVYISAHRNIMARASSPFRCMLQGHFSESRTEHIVIRGITPTSFQKLIDFIYTEKLEDFDMELQEKLRVLLAADRYEVTALASEIISQITRQLTLQTHWEVMAVADVLSVSQPDLLVACEDFLADHLREIACAGNSQFGLCPEKILLKVLTRDHLHGVASEKDVYLAALQWLDHDTQRMRNSVLRRRVMECVRFPCMSPKDFSQLVRRSEVVEDFMEREALCVFSGLTQLSTHWPASRRHAPRTMGECSMIFSPVHCEENRLSMANDRRTVVCVADQASGVFVRQPLLVCLEQQEHAVWRLDLRNCINLPSVGVAVYNIDGQFMAACGLCANSLSSTELPGPQNKDGAVLCSFQRVSLSIDPVTGDFVSQSDTCTLHFGRSASVSFMFTVENNCPHGCAIRTAHTHARLFSSVLTPRQHTSLAFIAYPNSYHVCPYVGLRPGMIATIGTS